MRQIVSNCLEKDPANRFQSARDLAFALGALSQAGAQSGSAPALAKRSSLPRWAILAFAAAMLALGIFAGRLLQREPSAASWSGVMLGGPERAFAPRPSPDGHLLAFIAPDADDFMQVWVMKPETGNRVLLTHNRDHGYAWNLSWSPDGSRIYFDRNEDSPKGVYSVPVLGGEEQLVLESAAQPEALPDGSILLTRLNAEHLKQLFRYRPDSGKLRAYPVETSEEPPRAFPGGRQAALVGTGLGPGVEAGTHLFVLGLEAGTLRALSPRLEEAFYVDGTAAAVPSRDGKAVIFSLLQGNSTHVSALPLDGSPGKPLLNLTSQVYSMDTGPDGSLYLDQVDRPMDLVSFSAKGGRVERLATLAGAAAMDNFAVLPDGRAVWPERAAGRVRLLLLESGKQPVQLVNTAEDNTGPLTAAGPGEVAFLIGPVPRKTIALAAVSTGRITRRIAFDKGRIDAMAASPDGGTIYCVAGGMVWAVPASGSAPRKIRAGDSIAVDAAANALFVVSKEHPQSRLFRVPLEGGPETEIPLTGPYRIGAPVNQDAVRNGRFVTSLGSSRWYNPPGIFDLSTGKSALVKLDYTGDFWRMAWSTDGNVIGEALGWNSTMWKFTLEVR